MNPFQLRALAPEVLRQTARSIAVRVEAPAVCFVENPSRPAGQHKKAQRFKRWESFSNESSEPASAGGTFPRGRKPEHKKTVRAIRAIRGRFCLSPSTIHYCTVTQ